MKKNTKEKSWFGHLMEYAAGSKGQLICSVILSVVSVVSGIIPYYSVYKIIKSFIAGTASSHTVLFWCAIALAAYMVKVVFFGLSTGMSHNAAYHILEKLRLRVADRFLHAPLGDATAHSIGEIKNIMVDKIENIEPPLAHLIPEGAGHIVLPVVSIIALAMVDWRIALASLVTVPFSLICMALTFKISGKNFIKYNESNAYMNSVIVEYIEGIEVIKAFGRAGVSYEKYAGAIKNYNTFIIKWLSSTWVTMKLAFALFPSTLLGTLPVALLLGTQGVVTAAEAALCVMLSMSMVASLAKLEVFSESIREMQFTIENLQEFLTMPELHEPSEKAVLHGSDVTLHNVRFSYTGDKAQEVLHGIDLTLPQGSFTALVGPSGGGKSTVAKLIARFWDVTEGEISIGGVNVKDMPISQLADTVSFVTQDNFLFRCSLLENIRLGNPKATDEEVYAAAKAAQCEEFIQKLSAGYNTPAGEAGKRLSGGEKQRIAIARMILKNAPVVILDEATAFTDPENEDKLQRSISALTKGKTLLVIAHRLSTIRGADNIAVLENGKIAAQGRQETLLDSCPIYRNMWDAHIGAKSWAVSAIGRGNLSMFRTVRRIINWCGSFRGKLYVGFIFAFFSIWFAAMPIMVAAYTMGMLIDDARGVAVFDHKWILLSLLLIAALVLLRFLFDYLRAKFQEAISYELVTRDRLAIGDALKRVSLGYFQTMNTGNILNSITTGLHTLENMGIRMVNSFVGGYLNFLCVFLCLFVFNPTVSLIALAGASVSFLFLLLVSKHSIRNAPVSAQANRDLTNATIEYARGLPVVKSFGQDGASMEAMTKACRDSRDINLKIEWGFTPANCLHLLAIKTASVALAAATFYLGLSGQMELPTVMMFAFFSFTIFAELEPISDSAHVLGIIDNAMDQLDCLKKESFIDADGKEIILEHYDISFHNVNFGYDSRPILKDVSLSIPEKTSTAIVGPSGSGKTTICNLISRFYDVNSGSITVGGHDVREFSCDSLLKNISMVFQNVYLFHDTIRSNILFGKPEATEEEMIEAAKKACCHDFIMALPDGYETIVGEGGGTLSGGEKQRISIARAILKDAPIIILDEATASVDPENEHLIQAAISELTLGKTIVTIAHRLATIENADQIIVVDDGRVAQSGTHEKLAAQEGRYKRFIEVRRQAEGWSIA